LAEGEKCDGFYIVESGKLQVVEKGCPIREIDKGEFFGELCILLDTPVTATVQSITNCYVWFVGIEDFKKIRKKIAPNNISMAKIIERSILPQSWTLSGDIVGAALNVPRKRHVNFDRNVRVILIATRNDIAKWGIADDLWYGPSEYFYFQDSARDDLRNTMKKFNVDLNKASIILYQQQDQDILDDETEKNSSDGDETSIENNNM
jgi:hypothetical protein